MKKQLSTIVRILLILFILINKLIAQNVGINSTGATPDASAILDIVSSNKGVLVPRVSLSSTTLSSPITSPATSLLVYNTATAGSGATVVAPGYYYWDGTQWQQLGLAGDDWSLLGNAGTTAGTNFIGTTDAVDWVVKTNNTERIRVKSTGNVGIGTTFPFAKFHVVASGTTGILGYSSGSNVSGVVAQSTGTNSKGIQATSDLGTAGKFTLSGAGTSIISAFDGATEVFTVDDGGFVGIGTTIPIARLHVQETTGLIGAYITNAKSGGWGIGAADLGAGSAGIGLYATSATGTAGFFNLTGSGEAILRCADGGSTVFVVDAGGNVGVGGLAIPARPLHIEDVMRLEPRATAPSGASEGDIYMNSTSHKLMVYDGTTWQACW
jgi:hypothetical protein